MGRQTMDDTRYGTHNKRGDFTPNESAQIAPALAGRLKSETA
jgi:hypothetical protein